MITPIAAGSISDLAGRVVAERMRVSLGQPIIVENVSGADGTIGAGRAARATPDGYTIIFGFVSAMALTPVFIRFHTTPERYNFPRAAISGVHGLVDW